MSAPAETTVTEAQRATLAGLADVLIPAADGQLSASEADPNGKWLARALAARPDLGEALARVLDETAGRDPAGEARRLHADDPEGFAALSKIVSGAYFMNLKVRKRIRFPGQGKRPPFPDEADYDLRDGLLDPVLAHEPGERPAAAAAPPNGRVEPLPFPLSRSADRADVLVIGAGAGGSVAARYLAEAGFRVVCLEQGDWANPDEFPGDKLEFELVSEAQWSPDPNVRRQPADYPLEISQSPITPVMYNAVGGSTDPLLRPVGAHAAPGLQAAFTRRLRRRLPISYDEMKPYYERIDQDMQISGMSGDPSYPAGPAPALPPIPIGPLGRKAAEGMNALGWHWWPAAHAIRSATSGTLQRASEPAPACGAARRGRRARPTPRCGRRLSSTARR